MNPRVRKGISVELPLPSCAERRFESRLEYRVQRVSEQNFWEGEKNDLTDVLGTDRPATWQGPTTHYYSVNEVFTPHKRSDWRVRLRGEPSSPGRYSVSWKIKFLLTGDVCSDVIFGWDGCRHAFRIALDVRRINTGVGDGLTSGNTGYLSDTLTPKSLLRSGPTPTGSFRCRLDKHLKYYDLKRGNR